MTERTLPPHASLHVFGLWAIALAEPVLAVLSRAPEFFVAYRATPVEILLLVLAVLLAVPAALVGLVYLIDRANPRAGRAAHLLVIGLLAATLAVEGAKDAGVARWMVALPIALAVGLAARA